MAELTPVQKAAIARADAVIAPALQLYEERSKVARLVGRLPLRDIERLNRVLERLSDDDLRTVASYAEALADWNAPP
jgi:hypothetical protein